ncbi:MAG: type II toxin-antitoxin system VapC family toxin [Anaerolineales bacterium]
MILVDVNVLVYAYRDDADRHAEYRAWLEAVINGHPAYGFSELILSGFIRVVTNPRIFNSPTKLGAALAFADLLRHQPNAVAIAPGTRHWDIFQSLCQTAAAKGNLVADAYLAAMAIESGSEWITTDRDFSRFQNLKWRHPLD